MTEKMMQNAITTKLYWEKYYSGKTADVAQIEQNGKVYDKYWEKSVDENTQSVIEIGAFPGRFLSYISGKYNLRPTALDFQSDLSVIEKTFQAYNIQNYNLINEDFLKWKSEEKYDLVLSLGFVEHFENYQEIIEKHFELVGKGGRVFLQVPNKRWLRKLYGLLADRENLKAHNLKVMSLDVFRKAAARNNMEIETLEYFGPFQYGLHGNYTSLLRRTMYRGFRFIFKTLNVNSLVEKYPSGFWSSCIICIVRKK